MTKTASARSAISRTMLDDDFNRRRANLVRELAGRADPFTKRRLMDLISRYEKPPAKTKPLPPISLGEPVFPSISHDEK